MENLTKALHLDQESKKKKKKNGSGRSEITTRNKPTDLSDNAFTDQKDLALELVGKKNCKDLKGTLGKLSSEDTLKFMEAALFGHQTPDTRDTAWTNWFKSGMERHDNVDVVRKRTQTEFHSHLDKLRCTENHWLENTMGAHGNSTPLHNDHFHVAELTMPDKTRQYAVVTTKDFTYSEELMVDAFKMHMKIPGYVVDTHLLKANNLSIEKLLNITGKDENGGLTSGIDVADAIEENAAEESSGRYFLVSHSPVLGTCVNHDRNWYKGGITVDSKERWELDVDDHFLKFLKQNPAVEKSIPDTWKKVVDSKLEKVIVPLVYIKPFPNEKFLKGEQFFIKYDDDLQGPSLSWACLTEEPKDMTFERTGGSCMYTRPTHSQN